MYENLYAHWSADVANRIREETELEFPIWKASSCHELSTPQVEWLRELFGKGKSVDLDCQVMAVVTWFGAMNLLCIIFVRLMQLYCSLIAWHCVVLILRKGERGRER